MPLAPSSVANAERFQKLSRRHGEIVSINQPELKNNGLFCLITIFIITISVDLLVSHISNIAMVDYYRLLWLITVIVR